MEFGMVIMLIQLFFGVVIGLYFWNLLRGQKTNRSAVERESRKELEKAAQGAFNLTHQAVVGEDASSYH